MAAYRGDEQVMYFVTGAAEAAKALLHFGFEQLKLHRIFADCAADNPASAHVMAKAGMRQEGHFRENKRIGEQWHDTLLYAILDWEWKAQRSWPVHK